MVNPTLRIALSIVALLPTPQLRTAALLDVMRAEVTQRAQADEIAGLMLVQPPTASHFS